MTRHYQTLLLAFVLLTGVHPETLAWGSGGHKYVNRNAAHALPPSMSLFAAHAIYLEQHASDADYRKGSDPTEDPKHYIDLEAFAGYHHLPRTLDSMISMYGQAAVTGNGYNPWAALAAFDSLRNQLARRDTARAYQTAADLGHYVGDGHQPLHCTVNYNGTLTGNTGIHSRYETGMLDRFKSQLPETSDSVFYIADPIGFILDYTLSANALVDSILKADTEAKLQSWWSGAGTAPEAYYTSLWEQVGGMTAAQLRHAVQMLSSLWYTAWVDAGLGQVTALTQKTSASLSGFRLEQNYPNPFNPSTTITYYLSAEAPVRLSVYALDGRLLADLVNMEQSVGTHAVRFDARTLSSGAYFYRLTVGGASVTRRLLLLR